jgi:hypothetical protein
MKALVDTGAEVNVIRRGMVPSEFLTLNDRPITLSGADSTMLNGGKMGAEGTAVLEGVEIDTNSPLEIQSPIHFYEANIAAQAILSYGWLGEQNFLVNPRRHGLFFQDGNHQVWLGVLSKAKEPHPHGWRGWKP